MGASTDQLTDGLYTITYKLVSNSDHTSVINELEQIILIDGAVRGTVYDALREISRQYDDEINNESREIMETLLQYSYLEGMNASATVGQQTEIINMLWTLNKLTADGSKYTW
jgi:hypothetical protein